MTPAQVLLATYKSTKDRWTFELNDLNNAQLHFIHLYCIIDLAKVVFILAFTCFYYER